MPNESSNGVTMRLPSFIGGNDPGKFLKGLGLRGSRNADGSWNVRRASNSVELVKAITLSAPWMPERKFDLLTGYTWYQDEAESQEARALYNWVDAMLAPRRAAGDQTAWFYRAQTAVMSVPDSEIALTVDDTEKGTIGNLRTPNNEVLFPGRSCHAVVFGRELYSRSKLPQSLIGFDQDPQLLTDLAAASAKGQLPSERELPAGRIFDSNAAILESLTFGANYLAPLLGCCSPRVWAVHGQRMFTVILFALGKTAPGIELTPSESLQLLPHAWAHGEWPAAPGLQEKSCAQAIDWWVMKLQKMFEFLSDPTYFRDSGGNYLPYLHQNWMMTVDQVFQRLGSIATANRDVYAQQVLMFGAIDAIGDRIYGSGSPGLYRPSRAQEALTIVRACIRDDAAKLILPQAERAVTAITEVRDGFFIRERRGTPGVHLVNSRGQVENWDMDHATKELLFARRNATHGFGHWRDHDGDNVRILAHHNGRLPRDLVYLPYLYLLEMLSAPSKMIDAVRAVGDGIS